MEVFVLSPTDVAKITGYTNTTIKRYLKANNLPYERLNNKDNSRMLLHPQSVAKILASKGISYEMQKVVMFANGKGGVGKTTSNVNYAIWLSEQTEKPVVLLDFDSSSSATGSLLRESEFDDNLLTLTDCLKQDRPFRDAVIPSKYPNLYLMPANAKTMKAEKHAREINPGTFVRKRISPLFEEFAAVIIDPPPSLNSLIVSAYLATDKLIVPVTTDSYSLDSLEILLEELEEMREEFNCKVPEVKILINKFIPNRNAFKETYDYLTTNHRDKLIPLYMPESTKILACTNNGGAIVNDCPRAIKDTFINICELITPPIKIEPISLDIDLEGANP